MTGLWMPGAIADPLAPVQSQPRMRSHDVICIHTMAGSLAGTSSMFHGNGWAGTESHFGTGPRGEKVQWQDIAYSADANLDGNGYVISIENADVGPEYGAWNTNDGSAVPGFTDAQMEAIAEILAWASSPEAHASCPSSWACHRDGIPLTLIPDTRPGRRGVGYHAQGVSGVGLVPGGVQWSNARGKVCPGARRIAQIPRIIRRAEELRSGVITPPPSEEDTDMTPEQDAKLNEALARLQTITVDIWTQRINGPGVVDQPAQAVLASAMTGAFQGRDAVEVSFKSNVPVDIDALAAALAERLDRSDIDALAARLQITSKP